MVTPFVSFTKEGFGNNCTNVRVNLTYRCGDIKYFNSKSAT